jgi:hypothetical protein
MRKELVAIRWIVLVLLCPCWGYGQAAEPECIAHGPYFGLGGPGLTPVIFAPGVVSTEHHDDWIPVFSPDGREVILRIVGKMDGVNRGVLFTSRMDGSGCWSVPEALPFSGTSMDGGAAFSADGNRLFFGSKRPSSEDLGSNGNSRLWVSERKGKGWSEPELLDSPINSFNVNGGLSVAADGSLYVAMSIPGGVGGMDIYVVPSVDGRYPQFQPLKGDINTASTEVGPFADPGLRFILYTLFTDGEPSVVLSLPDGAGGWSAGLPIPVLDERQPKFVGISPDGEVVFFVSQQQRDGSNPAASWLHGFFEGPAMADNADVYWVKADEVLSAAPGCISARSAVP